VWVRLKNGNVGGGGKVAGLEKGEREQEVVEKVNVERCCWFMCTATCHNYTSHSVT